jgi:glutamine synthetase
MSSFVERHGLWTVEQSAAAVELEARLAAREVEVVRFVFPDQHGVLRGKTLVAQEAAAVLRNGVNITSTLLAKDTSHKTVFPVFSRGGGFAFAGMQGGADFLIIADPLSFRVLPWANKTGWVLCDPWLNSGQPSPLGSRQILQRALAELGGHGFEFVAGLEVEFYAFRLEDQRRALHDSGQPGSPPEVSLLTQGYQYLTELCDDMAAPLMDILREQLQALGLPLRSLEVEYGPSQFELTFGPMAGMASADTMVLLRNAIKQICQRNGYHATFMCRPKIPNAMSSGWHLHQSLRDAPGGRNAFLPEIDSTEALSATGQHYLGGLLAHAPAATLLACPTINAYRRLRPLSLAPDRAIWAHDNRGAMLRVIGGAGQGASRIENRIGEPAANPYLYMASQVFSGLDGLQRTLDPGPSADAPYETPAPALPRSLSEAIEALRADRWLCQRMGEDFINYLCFIKEAELARFNLEVSEWEQREYFGMF